LDECSSLLRPDSAIFPASRRRRACGRPALGDDNGGGHADDGGVLSRYVSSTALGNVHREAYRFLRWILFQCRHIARCKCCRADNTVSVEFKKHHGKVSGF
jgi:hypothetical protein